MRNGSESTIEPCQPLSSSISPKSTSRSMDARMASWAVTGCPLGVELASGAKGGRGTGVMPIFAAFSFLTRVVFSYQGLLPRSLEQMMGLSLLRGSE